MTITGSAPGTPPTEESRTRRLLEAAIKYLPAGLVLVEAPSGRPLFKNPEADRIFGVTPGSIQVNGVADYQVCVGYRADGERYQAEDWPLSQSIRTGEIVTGEEARIVRADGSEGHIRITSAPVYDETGNIIAGLVTYYDITPTKQLEADLKRLAESEQQARNAAESSELALREASLRKDEFLAMLGHELRNPLAAISSALGMVVKGSSPPVLVPQATAIISRQTANLVRMVDNLLDVSRVTRGLVELKTETLDAEQLVRNALDAVRQAMEQKRHLISLSLPSAPVRVIGDSVRLEQVLVNLLMNATKFTPPGGRIRVEVETDRTAAVFRVIDSGVGIEAGMLGHVFDLFQQAPTGVDRSQSGLGVGLTVAKRLVECHGGTIRARSEGSGAGSEFSFTLPLAAAPEAAVSPAASRDRGEFAPLRVLVVDDHHDSRDMLCLLLESWGHTVYAAADGAAGLRLAATCRPQLALLDIGLPGLDGYEMARQLRHRPETSGVVLAALTGYSQPADRQRSTDAGFSHHLVKPVSAEGLRELIASVGN